MYVATAEWIAPETSTFIRLSGTWMLKVDKRRLNGKWHHDRYWIAPDCAKSRSRPEITKYLIERVIEASARGRSRPMGLEAVPSLPSSFLPSSSHLLTEAVRACIR